MDRRKLYGVWLPTDELLGIPLVAYHWLRGKKIRDLLFEKLHAAREKSKNCHLSEKDITELKIQYDELDNVFSDWFKQIEKSPNHTFQEKIDYCLKRFRTESLRNLTASRTLILQENFLKGAEKTLFLYFLLYGEAKSNNSFMSIFSSEENYNKFINVMKYNSYLDEKNQFNIPVIFFSSILEFLRKNGIIKKVKNIEIIKSLKDDFNFEISPSSFSNATPYPTRDEEGKLFDDLSKEFVIKY